MLQFITSEVECRVGSEVQDSPAAIRKRASNLGLRLEVDQRDGQLIIIAYEIQTGLQMKDLPRMEKSGYWHSWIDSLSGLRELEQNI